MHFGNDARTRWRIVSSSSASRGAGDKVEFIQSACMHPQLASSKSKPADSPCLLRVPARRESVQRVFVDGITRGAAALRWI